MAKPEKENLVEDQLLEEGLDGLENLADDDYVFVIGGDGMLKNVIFPPDVDFEYSEKLLKIFKAIGIDDPDVLLETPTLH